MEQEFEFETGYHATVETETHTDMDRSLADTESVEEKPLQVHLDKWLWAARFIKPWPCHAKPFKMEKFITMGSVADPVLKSALAVCCVFNTGI